MMGTLLSVLAGLMSAAAWDAIKWACASVRARKKPAPDDDQAKRA